MTIKAMLLKLLLIAALLPSLTTVANASVIYEFTGYAGNGKEVYLRFEATVDPTDSNILQVTNILASTFYGTAMATPINLSSGAVFDLAGENTYMKWGPSRSQRGMYWQNGEYQFFTNSDFSWYSAGEVEGYRLTDEAGSFTQLYGTAASAPATGLMLLLLPLIAFIGRKVKIHFRSPNKLTFA